MVGGWWWRILRVVRQHTNEGESSKARQFGAAAAAVIANPSKPRTQRLCRDAEGWGWDGRYL